MTQPVYAPNSYGRGYADLTGGAEDGWEADGEMVREAYALRPEDDDFGQAGTMVREVWDDEQRERFVSNVAGHILGGVSDEAAPAGLRLLEERRRRTPASGSRSRAGRHARIHRRRHPPSARASSRRPDPTAAAAPL